MLRRTLLAAALALLACGAPRKIGAANPCTADALTDDLRSTLIGTIDVSNLTIYWRTGNEGSDLLGYEVWARAGGKAVLVATVAAVWNCPMRVEHSVLVAYDSHSTYYVEIHLRDRTIRAIPVPIVMH